MNERLPEGVEGARLRHVPDARYLAELRSLMAHAVQRLWCSIFIVELSSHRDPELCVDSLLEELECAVWRGVDTRLLIGGSRTNATLAHLAELARATARRRAIPCRWLTSSEQTPSHLKLVVADECVLTGSHNWSPGALSGRQVQDSVLIDSRDLAAFAANVFSEQWSRAGETA